MGNEIRAHALLPVRRMPFSYHPPTTTECPVCEELARSSHAPLVDQRDGKAAAAGGYPVHNWYYFVLGYTPEFPDHLIRRFDVDASHLVVDPFMGSGTTLVCCKARGIPSVGVDANDFFVDAARVKLRWDLDTAVLREQLETILGRYSARMRELRGNDGHRHLARYAEKHRPPMLTERYVSDVPFAKLHVLRGAVEGSVPPGHDRDFFNLALSSVIVPASNVAYGPGFGVRAPKEDEDVLGMFEAKAGRMIADVETIPADVVPTPATAHLGDSRDLLELIEPGTVDLMITSPPYPGDHEYTKHSRVELIFMGYANSIAELRDIKQTMIRGSTTNVYKRDDDGRFVEGFDSIHRVTGEIDRRLRRDNATSGFEKLYTKLVREYFGGMYRVLEQAHAALRPGGRFSLLVSDSHSFKMVHISTADILREIGLEVGFSGADIDLWQLKRSTSHGYDLRENCLTLRK